MLLDKFYTPKNVAIEIVQTIKSKLGEEITEWFEPSAGSGVFSKIVDNCLAFDIAPDDDSIIKQDFLTAEINYKKGRLVFGNPPFGKRNNLALKFFKKAIQIGDFVAFILPISQLNNTNSFYDFDLIYSKDLGVLNYSGKNIHCCFNIFKRPHQQILNKKPRLDSSLFKIYRNTEKKYHLINEDFKIIKRGNVGKVIDDNSQYSDEYKVVVADKSNLDFVKNKITSFDWKNFKIHQSAPHISKNDIYSIFQ